MERFSFKPGWNHRNKQALKGKWPSWVGKWKMDPKSPRRDMLRMKTPQHYGSTTWIHGLNRVQGWMVVDLKLWEIAMDFHKTGETCWGIKGANGVVVMLKSSKNTWGCANEETRQVSHIIDEAIETMNDWFWLKELVRSMLTNKTLNHKALASISVNICVVNKQKNNIILKGCVIIKWHISTMLREMKILEQS